MARSYGLTLGGSHGSIKDNSYDCIYYYMFGYYRDYSDAGR